ncbi:hypothetical protein PR048_017275 [Dryococelus australis]|uniref:Mitochondrial ribosomal protein S18A n=1 Tax=Dryococelus australis TaxID=614101 RepID=A0ABQ9H926_9NEOP|nr:hypothetical protein PR048_017275 [Dryococelus australis]
MPTSSINQCENLLFATVFRTLGLNSLKFTNISAQWSSRRNFVVTNINYLKEIQERQEDKTRIVEGVIVPSPREPYLVRTDHGGACPLCSLGLDLKHTDVLILSQFLRQNGCMLPRRVTGLCKKQHIRVTKMVQMAQKAGLMSNINPERSKKDAKLRWKWKKFNTYFDEETIKVKIRP